MNIKIHVEFFITFFGKFWENTSKNRGNARKGFEKNSEKMFSIYKNLKNLVLDYLKNFDNDLKLFE